MPEQLTVPFQRLIDGKTRRGGIGSCETAHRELTPQRGRSLMRGWAGSTRSSSAAIVL